MCVPKQELSLSRKQQHSCKGRGRRDKGTVSVASVVPSLLLLRRQGASAGPAEPRGAPGARCVLGPAPSAVVN